MMPCAHALLLREVSDFDAFKDVIPDRETREKFVKYGFVEWGDHPEEFAALLTPEALQKLRVLFMWAKPELGGEPLLQVFTAAVPTCTFGNSGSPLYQTDIAMRLLGLQYRAIAQLAVIRARLSKPDTRVSLHLTLAGIGAFQNSPLVIKTSLKEVEHILKSEPIDVYIHAYDYNNLDSISHQILETFVLNGAEILTGEEFLMTE